MAPDSVSQDTILLDESFKRVHVCDDIMAKCFVGEVTMQLYNRHTQMFVHCEKMDKQMRIPYKIEWGNIWKRVQYYIAM